MNNSQCRCFSCRSTPRYSNTASELDKFVITCCNVSTTLTACRKLHAPHLASGVTKSLPYCSKEWLFAGVKRAVYVFTWWARMKRSVGGFGCSCCGSLSASSHPSSCSRTVGELLWRQHNMTTVLHRHIPTALTHSILTPAPASQPAKQAMLIGHSQH